MTSIGQTVAVIGGGSMGGAIASGLVESGTCSPERVLVCDHHPDRLAALAASCGVTTYPTADDLLAERPDVVILAVKPQVLVALLRAEAASLGDALVISIAAGVAISTLEGALPRTRVVRAMPNLPISVRSGATAIACGSHATAEDVELVRELFSAVGSAQIMREEQLDAEGAVVSCAPAYFALMVDALTRAGVKAGLPAAACRDMVEATMLGVARSLSDTGEHPRAYMERVTSPGGTTAAALEALEPQLERGSYDAVDAALNRTRELAGD